MNSTPFPNKKNLVVNHFHFNINVPKTIEEDSREEAPPAADNQLQISEENRKSLRESYQRMKDSIENPKPEEPEMAPLESEDLEQLYASMRQSIKEVADDLRDSGKFKSYLREDSTSSEDENGDGGSGANETGSGESETKFMDDFVKSLQRLTKKDSNSCLIEGPKFDTEKLKKLSMSEIGRQSNNQVLSSVEPKFTEQDERDSSPATDNFFLEDLVNEGNTVRDLKKFQDIHSLVPSQMASKSGRK